MKYLKLVIALCGAVGMVAIAAPLGNGSLLAALFARDMLEGAVYAAVFALPLAMGGLALIRPPMQAWQSGIALSGFVIGIVRFRVWEALPQLSSAGLAGALRLTAVVVGTIVAIIALWRPEAPA